MQTLADTSTSSLVQLTGVPPSCDFRPSRFNARATSADGTLVLYNSMTGALSGFPAKMKEQVISRLARRGFRGELEGLNKYLYDRGFIVLTKTDEYQRLRMLYGAQQYKNDRLELILLSSEECNFRCIYCYETFPRGTMEPWVRQAVARLVETRAYRLNELNVAWFGGEPLLGYEAIEELAPQFLRLAQEHDIAFTSDITTNGYLLTLERFQSLLRWNVRSYQVTIDGSRETHDAHRVLAGGGGTFDVIMSNLRAMKTVDDVFHVSLRVNFDRENLPCMDEFMDELKADFGDDPRFVLRFYPVGKWGGQNDARLNTCGQTAEAERRNLQLEASRKGILAESKFLYMQPSMKMGVCYAARPYNLLIGADGKIMKCTIALDTRDYNIVGQMQPDGRAEIDLDKMSRWVAPYYEDDPACRSCFYVPVCQGCSCPLEVIEGIGRPCPPEKNTIVPTLATIWQTKSSEGNPVSVPSRSAAPR
jgi:uncharacterized protein